MKILKIMAYGFTSPGMADGQFVGIYLLRDK